MLLRDKKGISLMIGYVLLVVIAVGLATLVFSYLKNYVPSDKPICPEDTALSIESMSCNNGEVKLTLMNRGLFNLDGAYVRIGEIDRKFKELISKDTLFERIYKKGGLFPGELYDGTYMYTGTGPRELEVEPALFVDNEWVLCNKAIVRQNIECSNNPARVIINKPIDKQNSGLDIPVNIIFKTINGLSECSYELNMSDGTYIDSFNIDDGSCESTELRYDDTYGLELNPGDYKITAHVKDDKGNVASSVKSFSVGGELINKIYEPSANNYSFVDLILNIVRSIPLKYEVQDISECKAFLIRPDNTEQRLTSISNECSLIGNMPESFFYLHGTYRVELRDVGNNPIGLFKDFDVLTDPEVSLTPSVGGILGCDLNLDWVITTRKDPLDTCSVRFSPNGGKDWGYLDTGGMNNCKSGSVNFPNVMPGIYTLVASVEYDSGKIVEDGPMDIEVPDGGSGCDAMFVL